MTDATRLVHAVLACVDRVGVSLETSVDHPELQRLTGMIDTALADARATGRMIERARMLELMTWSYPCGRSDAREDCAHDDYADCLETAIRCR